eukprot:scaffold2553_cov138-Cylindrotheca_fusiformis.AAC.21
MAPTRGQNKSSSNNSRVFIAMKGSTEKPKCTILGASSSNLEALDENVEFLWKQAEVPVLSTPPRY